MPAPRWLNVCRWGTRACASGACALLCWCLWLILGITLVVLISIATLREMALPGFALRQIEARLAEAGLRASFGAAKFDPVGHVVIQDLRVLATVGSDPLVTAETLLIELDPWALLVGQVDVDAVQVSGAEALVPALLSPSGRSEPWLHRIDGLVERDAGDGRYRIRTLTARLGEIAVVAEGALPAPRPTTAGSATERLQQAVRLYPRISHRIAGELARMPELEEPHLRITVEDGGDEPVLNLRFDVARGSLPVGYYHLPHAVSLRAVELQAHLRLEASRPVGGTVALRADEGLVAGHRVQHLRLTAQAGMDENRAVRDLRLEATAEQVETPLLNVRRPTLSLHMPAWPQLKVETVGELHGDGWWLEGQFDVRARSGQVRWAGAVDRQWIGWFSQRLKRDLAAQVDWTESPLVEGRATFAGGAPVEASARVRTAAVRVRGVELDTTGADVAWRPDRLVAEDIRLTKGLSEAAGRYEMDPGSRDFQLLLQGRLQPQVINGWFRDWWSNFWQRFDFPLSPPVADVEVRGRIGSPERTEAFVAADGAPVVLQGAAFERIRTRVVARRGFVDALEFIGNRAEGEARGRFVRRFQPGVPQSGELTFDVISNTSLEPGPALFGEIGRTLTAPFTFSQPPNLHVRGQLDGPNAPGGRRADVMIDGAAAGPWAFYLFPLHDLHFAAHLQDDLLLIEDIGVGFAGGWGSGRAELRGLQSERSLAFDVTLNDARLGESIHTLEQWGAERRGEPAPPISRFQRQVAAGLLDLALSAEGNYDDPYSLHGAGNAVLTGADLGEVNMLGVLSALLRRTMFNFTTLQLDTARANFRLAGPNLRFEQLVLSGPRAAVEATGDYRLDRKTLDFTARVLPFGSSENFFATTVGAMLTPLSNVLEVRLDGPIDAPNWAFVYGPSNLLRNLGADPAAPGEEPPPRPPLRRP